MHVIKLTSIAVMVLCAGCSAVKAVPEAKTVFLVEDKPAQSCQYLGEAIGSQGNFLSGNFTASDKLMEGARNDLRNKAVDMSGNTVHVQNITSSQSDDALGTTNTLVVGHVYRC